MSKIIDAMIKDVKAIPDTIKQKLGQLQLKQVVKKSVPYLIVGYVMNKLSWLYHLLPGDDMWGKLMDVANYMSYAFVNPLPSFALIDLGIGAGCGIAFYLMVYFKKKNAKKMRPGVEYGSARWGTAKDIEPYIDDDPDRNIILTKTESLSLSARMKNPKIGGNKNILVIGGSGSGKTRFFAKPNLMQLHSSYVVTDPKATILLECGKMFEHYKYKIKIFNTINFGQSQHYNPFHYIRNEEDISTFVETLIINTQGNGQQSDGDFWTKAEKLYFSALIGLIWYEAPEEEQTFSMLLDLIDASETREEDETFKNAVDLLFDELKEKSPDHFAVRKYRRYKLAAGKTAKSILISCGARMSCFDIGALRELTSFDELELDCLGEEKTALFVIISDTNTTFNFLVSIMYTQLFNLLCDKALIYGGRLPIHVRCILDEFSNIGQIPNFEHLITTIRSREISASIIIQSKAQLKAIYKDNASTIEENCNTTLYLGGGGKDTRKDLSETLGKETIDMFNTSNTKGSSESYGVNYQKTGKDLMSPDEIAIMDRGKCLLFIDGERPFYSDKYDITKHKRYHLLADYDKKNTFDIEKYVKNVNKLKLKANDIIDETFDAGLIEA